MKKQPLGIYIHIPFCAKKCLYCDFASAPGTPAQMAQYFRVLSQEIRSFEGLGSLYTVRSVFFGGGTPSLVPEGYLRNVMRLLHELFEWEPDAEVSIECNPGTLTPEKCAAYREMGIGRLSLGLQSVHAEELARLGRIHSYREFEESFYAARRAGFRNINVDLMSGLPKQTKEMWQETLETVAGLRPEHISAYSLSLEPGTPFYERYGTPIGRMELPGEETEREMYRMTAKILQEAGYHRYEISNYAKEGYECRHNLAYWTGGEYVGFGQSAASYLNRRRFVNPAGAAEYLAFAKNAYAAYRNTRPQTEKEQMEEYMFLGLRTSRGVSAAEFSARFGKPFPEQYEKVIERYTALGFLGRRKGRIVLTEQGIDVSNPILSEFLLD